MDLTDEESRKKELAARSPSEVCELIAGKTVTELIAICRAAVSGLGVYEIELRKEERVKGKLLPPQTLRIAMRESPRAARLEFVDGPSKGRKVLYDASVRSNEMRVKEAGLLGIAGAIWLRLDNPLARADTNHSVTNLGYGALLDFFEQDLANAKPFGGHTRKDLGMDARGRWTSEFSAPAKATGLRAIRAKLSFELALGLPTVAEMYDEIGLLERYKYELVRRRIAAPAGFFEPKAFGM
jgi:hypothetical protein